MSPKEKLDAAKLEKAWKAGKHFQIRTQVLGEPDDPCVIALENGDTAAEQCPFEPGPEHDAWHEGATSTIPLKQNPYAEASS